MGKSSIKRAAKAVIPTPLWNWLGVRRRRWLSRHDASLSTREVFSRIYSEGLWSGEGDGPISGSGSRNAAVVEPYIEAIARWAREHEASRLVALDLGCGDFHVGSRIHDLFDRYIAADIVSEVVEHHRRHFDLPRVEFVCIDAIEDDLPEADVVFLRQVLQHLSNDQIRRILPKLRGFKHLILTEHIPEPSALVAPNLDKVQGGGIRLEQGSGVFLEASPFEIEAIEMEELLEVPASDRPAKDGLIRTTYFRLT